MSGNITLAGLWPNKSGNGHSGGFDKRLSADDLARAFAEGWRVALFANDRRDNPNAPELRVVLMPPREQQPQRSEPPRPGDAGYDEFNAARKAARAPQPDARFASPQPPRRGPQRDDLDDAIPF